MATISEISRLCKSGDVALARELALADIEKYPQYPWPLTNFGWVLYYQIKNDMVTASNKQKVMETIANFCDLEIPAEGNDVLFSNIIFVIARFVHLNLPETDPDSEHLFATVFTQLKRIGVLPCVGASYLLDRALKYKTWTQLKDFIEWWDLDNLRQEDFDMVKTSTGKSIMSLAERVHNAYTKCLITTHDEERIHDFIPRIESLIDNHPEMQYPCYCYMLLLKESHSDKETILKTFVPFARRKASDAWVWEKLADLLGDEPEKQMACLLRAVSCQNDESFLGNIRTKLAELYVSQHDYARAKHQVIIVNNLYLSKGWHMKFDLVALLRSQNIQNATPDKSVNIDYMAITNSILYAEAKQCYAVVSYVDAIKRRVSLIYGVKRRTSARCRFHVKQGDIVRIFYDEQNDGTIKLYNVVKANITSDINLPFLKFVTGVVQKKQDKDFAFVKHGADSAFISPDMVRQHNLHNGETIKCRIGYDYNKKKDVWSWVCMSVKKSNI